MIKPSAKGIRHQNKVKLNAILAAVVCFGAAITALSAWFMFKPAVSAVSLAESNPILIYNATQLMNIGNETYEESGLRYKKNGYYKLANDINIPLGDWIPYCRSTEGNANGPFIGTLDGGGYKILMPDGEVKATHNRFGIIGVAGEAAIFKDITVHFQTNTKFGGKFAYIGGLVGSADLLTTFTNCAITGDGTIVGGTGGSASGDGFVGGLVGYLNICNVFDCFSTVNITVSSPYNGGLIGRASGTKVTNSYATGNLTGTGTYANYLGGFIGYVGTETTIQNCYATGNITGSNIGGGFVATAESVPGFIDCFATGNVTTTGYHVGGFIGRSYSASFTRCSASGDIRGTYGVGGFAGGLYSSYEGTSTTYGRVPVFTDCLASGNVTSTGSNATVTDVAAGSAGGFVGFQTRNSTTNCGNVTYTRCIATGTVTSTATSTTAYVNLGGFMGTIINQYQTHSTTGVVTYWTTTFTRCVVAGNEITTAITGDRRNVGKFIGGRTIADITFSGWDYINEEIKHNGAEIGLNIAYDTNAAETKITAENLIATRTPLQLCTQSTYAGYNFTTTWDIQSDSFPTLRAVDAGAREDVQTHYITDANELMNIGSGNKYNGKIYNLYDDYIILNDITIPAGNWTPYCNTSAKAFAGTLDGGGNKITIGGDITATANYFGIIGYAVRGVFRDITIEIPAGRIFNNSGTGFNYGGALVGFIQSCSITNCNITGLGTVRGQINIGGLVGAGNTLTSVIRNCSSTVNVVGVDSGTGTYQIGGFMGYYFYVNLTDCWASGNVTAPGYAVGGFVGYANYNSSAIRCFATKGNVSGIYAVGGFVGRIGGGSFTNCYATGNVTGSGSHPTDVNDATAGNIGGFAGGFNLSNSSSYNQCYAAGSVTSTATSGIVNIGGFLGSRTGSLTSSNTLTFNRCAVMSSNIVTYAGSTANVGILIGYRSNHTLTITAGTNTLYNSAIKHNGNALTNILGLEYVSEPGEAVPAVTNNISLVVPRTLVQLKQDTTFMDLGWDFINVWIMDDFDSGFPIFRYFHPEIGKSTWIAFNPYGGTFATQIIPIEPGNADALTVPFQIPVLAGWTFKGWYSKDVGGALYIDTSFQITGDFRVLMNSYLTGGRTIELFARWESTITFNVFGVNNNAAYAPNALTITRGVALDLTSANSNMKTALPNGWVFASGDWYDTTANAYKTSGTTGQITRIEEDDLVGNRTLYARITAPVTYDVQGGTAVTAGTRVYGAAFTPAATATSSNSWVFDGWYNSQANARQQQGITDGKITSIAATDTTQGAVTLFARWKGTVTYNVLGNATNVASQSYTRHVGFDLPSAVNAAYIGNWTFTGWGTNLTTPGTKIAAISDTQVAANLTVYAILTKEITYYYNSEGKGTLSGGSDATITITYGNAYTLAAPSITDWRFEGWNLNSDGSGSKLQSGTWTSTTAPQAAIYAQWTDVILEAARAELETAIANCYTSVDNTLYTAASRNTLQGYILAAATVLTDGTTDEVQYETTFLNNANKTIAAGGILKLQAEQDLEDAKGALSSALNLAKLNADNTMYTQDSRDELWQLIDAAELVLNNSTVLSAVNAETDRINNANKTVLNGGVLILQADQNISDAKAALQNAITNATNKSNDLLYTSASRIELQSIIYIASGYLESSDVSEIQQATITVNEAVKLKANGGVLVLQSEQDAIDALAAARANLQTVIFNATAFVSNEIYTQKSRNDLQTVINAKIGYLTEGTIGEIQTAIQDIEKAAKPIANGGVLMLQADFDLGEARTALQAAIDAATVNIEKSLYTQSSRDELSDVITNAVSYLTSGVIRDIQECTSALNAANALISEGGLLKLQSAQDLEDALAVLQSAIDNAAFNVLDATYTETSRAALQRTIDAKSGLLSSNNIEDIYLAATALNNANKTISDGGILRLQSEQNLIDGARANLQKAIDDALESIGSLLYTQASCIELQEMITGAYALLGSENIAVINAKADEIENANKLNENGGILKLQTQQDYDDLVVIAESTITIAREKLSSLKKESPELVKAINDLETLVTGGASFDEIDSMVTELKRLIATVGDNNKNDLYIIALIAGIVIMLGASVLLAFRITRKKKKVS